jgi:hypothetical protein
MATGNGQIAVNGWQLGYREMNGYLCEIAVYGDPIGYIHHSINLVDFVTGEFWVADGCAKWNDILAKAEKIMRGNRADLRHYAKQVSRVIV